MQDAAEGPPSLSEAWSVEGRHTGCYTGGKVAWSEATRVLGSLCSEELHLVDVDTRAPTRRVVQDGDGVLTFALDPTGQHACTSHRSGLLRHFRLGEPVELVRSWAAHEQIVVDLCFDASGGLVASGSGDRTAKVWDFAGYFCTHSFRGHGALVSIVRFHPARLQLLTVAHVEVRLWDLMTSTCLGVMKDHLASVSSVCFASAGAGAQLVTGGRDQVVNVWRLEEGCALLRTVPVFESVEGVATVPTRGLLQASSLDGDCSKGPLAQWLRKNPKPPHYLFLTVGDKSLLRVWNPSDGQCVAEQASPHAAKGLLRQVHCLDQAEGQRIVTIGEDANLVIWSLPDLRVLSYIMGNNEEIVHVQLIPELTWPGAGTGAAPGAPAVTASRFVCVANDEHPRLVNCHGFGATLLRGHTDVVIACDVSADGRWIATGGKDQAVRIWSAAEAQCVCRLAGHAGAVSALSFPKRRRRRPQGLASRPTWLVSGSQDKTMKVWELPGAAKLAEGATAGGAELFVEKSKVTVVAHTKEVNDVTVSPDDKLIASGGHDKLVRVWSFPEGQLLGECKGHRRGIWCVAFSPIDQVLASTSGDGTVRLWNLKDYTAIRSFQGHSSAVLRVCFLANGMQMMTSSVDGLLKLWQIRTADCCATFEEHTGKVWCIDIVGQQMVSGGSDSKLCVWRDTTAERAKERHDAEAEAAIKDSRIGLLLRDGKVEAALSLALDLKRPGQMRQILTSYTMDVVDRSIACAAEPLTGGGGSTGCIAARGTAGGRQSNGLADATEATEADVDLQRWVLSLSSPQLEYLVDLLEQWNSNRRMSSVAQMLMGLVLLAVPPSRLAALEGMNATCSTILSYSGRHMSRVESLLQKTFLFDLVLQSSALGLSLEEPKPTRSKAPVAGGAIGPGAAPGAAEAALRRTMEALLGDEDQAEDQTEDRAEDQAEGCTAGDEGQGECTSAGDGTPGAAGPERTRGSRRASRDAGGTEEDASGGEDAEPPRARRKVPKPSSGRGRKRMRV